MNKAHVTLFALLVAGATLLGAVALARTTSVGRAVHHTKDTAIAAREKQLGAYAAKLQKELRAKPPALPPVPHPKPAAVAPAIPAPAPTPAPRIIYHRPPAIVTTVHTHHGDNGSGESEGGGEGGGDD